MLVASIDWPSGPRRSKLWKLERSFTVSVYVPGARCPPLSVAPSGPLRSMLNPGPTVPFSVPLSAGTADGAIAAAVPRSAVASTSRRAGMAIPPEWSTLRLRPVPAAGFPVRARLYGEGGLRGQAGDGTDGREQGHD